MTTTVSDPRTRTRTIHMDLTSPNRYGITIIRESVREMSDTGQVVARTSTRAIKREITFDAAGVPAGDPLAIALLPQVKAAVEAMEVADIAAETAYNTP